MSFPLALFVNTKAGWGDTDLVLRLWYESVPREARGPVFRVEALGDYDLELKQAITFCYRTGSPLVVVGGDGTWNSALALAAPRRITLGLIPAGTANYFAKTYGIPETPREAIRFLLASRSVLVPLAYANDEPFAVSFCWGASTKIMKSRRSVQRYLGGGGIASLLAALPASVRERRLSYGKILSLKWQEALPAPLLVVNAGLAELAAAELDVTHAPGELSVLRVRKGRRHSSFGLLWRMLTDKVFRADQVVSDAVNHLTLSTAQPRIRAVVDGERRDYPTPVTFRVEPSGFNCLLTPGCLAFSRHLIGDVNRSG